MRSRAIVRSMRSSASSETAISGSADRVRDGGAGRGRRRDGPREDRRRHDRGRGGQAGGPGHAARRAAARRGAAASRRAWTRARSHSTATGGSAAQASSAAATARVARSAARSAAHAAQEAAWRSAAARSASAKRARGEQAHVAPPPAVEPRHARTPSSVSRRRRTARCSALFTVPRFICRLSAISSSVISSQCRSTKTARWRSGRPSERGLDPLADLAAQHPAVGRGVVHGQRRRMVALGQRLLGGAAAADAAVLVDRLVDRDADQPRAPPRPARPSATRSGRPSRRSPARRRARGRGHAGTPARSGTAGDGAAP